MSAIVTREDLVQLSESQDELSKKAAVALQTLLDDLSKAQAQAAADKVNNGEIFFLFLVFFQRVLV
jgi:hypothetical protein